MALAHEDTGQGPTLVLLHAGIADRRMWSGQIEPLAAAGYRVIAPDLPGYGDSPPGDGERGEWDEVLGLMDGLGIERAHLAGNSLGGEVAMRVALTAPERVSSLALVSAPSLDFEPSPQLAAASRQEEDALAAGDIEGAINSVLETWTLADAPEGLRSAIATMQRRAFEVQAREGPRAYADDPFERRPESISELELPVLVVAGEHDLEEFRQAAEAMAEAIPDSHLALIEGAGHLAPLEQPAKFRELLLGHLRRPAL